MNRNQYLSAIKSTAKSIRELKGKVTRETWTLAGQFVGLRETYGEGSDHTAAFKSAAATAAQVSETYVDNLVRAFNTRKDLTAKQAERTSEWGPDAMLTLSNLDGSKRNSLIGKAEKAGTTNVKTIRDLKRDVTGKGKGKRNRKGKTAADVALMERLSEKFAELAVNHNVLDMIVGAQLAQENEGDVAAALTLWNAQAKPAATVV